MYAVIQLISICWCCSSVLVPLPVITLLDSLQCSVFFLALSSAILAPFAGFCALFSINFFYIFLLYLPLLSSIFLVDCFSLHLFSYSHDCQTL